MSEHEDILKAEVLTPEEQSRLLKAIYKALAGDPLDPESPGIVSRVNEMHIVLHGSDKTGVMGIKRKVDTLWEDRIKVVAICGVVGITAGFIGWLLPYIFHH